MRIHSITYVMYLHSWKDYSNIDESYTVFFFSKDQVICSQNQVVQFTEDLYFLQEFWALCLLLALCIQGVSPQDLLTLHT